MLFWKTFAKAISQILKHIVFNDKDDMSLYPTHLSYLFNSRLYKKCSTSTYNVNAKRHSKKLKLTIMNSNFEDESIVKQKMLKY